MWVDGHRNRWLRRDTNRIPKCIDTARQTFYYKTKTITASAIICDDSMSTILTYNVCPGEIPNSCGKGPAS